MKEIKGFENYKIDRDGRIANFKTGRFLKIQKNKKGYNCVQLSGNGKLKSFLIHRLVYELFKGEIAEDLEINHIDGDKNNNSIDNLEAITHQQNLIKAVEKGLIKSGEESCNSKRVASLDVFTEDIIEEFGSIRLASKKTGITSGEISSVCLKRRKTAGGYKWKFI